MEFEVKLGFEVQERIIGRSEGHTNTMRGSVAAHGVGMEHDSSELDVYSIATTRGIIMHVIHHENGRSMTSVSETETYAVSVGVRFEVGTQAIVQYSDGSHFTGGTVLSAPVLHPGARFGPSA